MTCLGLGSFTEHSNDMIVLSIEISYYCSDEP